nr:immunoglobulin light chain junction region [Macaca mulatta]MOX17003.1 immunoglobulin light chain junction region [Macaca mulatta]MOX17021.1 immunoglobulin light chain junction region [Macaca mulatta]MOX17058.1 immunoglobulin light chain junction region [Macaca mulatta]MOX17078.1 immunoglobulin light chain junction region [Macaca mulatta]
DYYCQSYDISLTVLF